jgi:ubiquinone/menaquinone biosynthesis C-methylase UbiE
MESKPNLEQLKEGMRRTWMAGDFGQIAQYSVRTASEFVDRLPIVPGMKVLDVACGTGNTAIPAARKGAIVTGVDIATNLLAQARDRAGAEGMSIKFEEGDVEHLPYADSEFDLVISMFGAMFAPSPEKVVSELARVCRSGGRIAMANWTPQGFTGQMFALNARHLLPPAGIAPPVLWGDEAVVRQRFAGKARDIQTTRRQITMTFPFPPEEVVQFFRQYFGPTHVAYSRMDAQQQAAYTADMNALWMQHNQSTTGETTGENEYLEVIVTRA